MIILITIELYNYRSTQGKKYNCDWLWENLSVTDKNKNLEIHDSIIKSVIF